MGKRNRLHTEDRKPFVLSDEFFLKRRGLYWSGLDHSNSEYLLALRRSKSREQVGRKVGRHPAQISRYEAKGYSKQLPDLPVLRKLCVVLRANPVKLLNLCLHFPSRNFRAIKKKLKRSTSLSISETAFVLEMMDWIEECSDKETRMLIKSLRNKIEFQGGEDE